MLPRDQAKRRSFVGGVVLLLLASGCVLTDWTLPSLVSDRLLPSRRGGGASGFCVTPELDGRWVRDRSRTFSAGPLCCGSDLGPGSYEDNPAQCGAQPQRPPAGAIYGMRGHPDFITHAAGHSCTCSTPERNFRDEYVWKSDALPEWDGGKTLCDLLGDRRVAMIGDSTMNQAAVTLMNAARGGGCQEQIYMAYGHTLIAEKFGAMNRGEMWNRTVELMDYPEIVVVTVGAHIYGEDNYERVIDTVLDGIERLRAARRGVTVVWKTQSPGACTDEIVSAHPLEAGRDFPWKETKQKYYQHDKFFVRDQETISRMKQHGVPVLDMRMLYSRTDAHVIGSWADCLHFCIPGPLDVIAVLFQKLLQTHLRVSECLKPNEIGNQVFASGTQVAIDGALVPLASPNVSLIN